MAEVLLAATQSTGVTKLAVLKCLWSDLAEDPAFVEMFLDEARLGVRLNHPNVVQTYEVVQHEGRLAMAMEYVDGPSLKSLLARLPGEELDLSARLRVIIGVLSALEYAHTLTALDGTALDVVHRDVSPHNVIVTYDGHVKLLDFGIAKTLDARHQTRPGGVKGKLAYLAPEAMRGGLVDRRADVFSVGVMLWEILVGRRLWGTTSESGLAARLMGDLTAPELPRWLDVPDELRAVCMRALSPDPAGRHQSAAELAADLESFGVDGSDTRARQLGRLVSGAFEPERAQRQALIGAHMNHLAHLARSDGDLDYVSFDLSLPEVPLSRQRRVAEPTVVPGAEPKAKARPVRRSRTVFIAASAAAVALVAGVYLGQGPLGWSALPSVSRVLAPITGVPSPQLPERSPFRNGQASADALAPTPIDIESLAPRRQNAAPERERHARTGRPGQSRRPPRPLDLLSDDVLGLDGAPLAASAAAGTSTASNDAAD